MKRAYQILDKKDIGQRVVGVRDRGSAKGPPPGSADRRALVQGLSREGPLFLPMLELIETAELTLDEYVDRMGRASIEFLLELAASRIAGPKTPGKKGGEVRWHGRQGGVVCLAERKLRVEKPRLRRQGDGPGREVSIPAYEQMQEDSRLARRVMEILMKGVSTRQYAAILPDMAETVGISKSSVSREFIEASTAALKALGERRWDDHDILVIYIDGQQFGSHHVLTAVGVDAEGYKHVLGLVSGASENAVAVKALLEDLVARGVKPGRHRLFVIDGSKALRQGIDAVYGADNPVQRCREHKIRNVVGHLPEEHRDQIRSVMKAAFRLDAKEGLARLEKQAQWLQNEWPSAANSLREGLDEMFTVNRLGLTPSLRRCLTSTNLIESPHSGVRRRTRRVSRWKDGRMVLRWAAASWLDTEAGFRRIMGYRDLWMLKARLDELDRQAEADLTSEEQVA